MSGIVYLGGGGNATDEAPLWREMLRNKRRITYWPFALEEHRFSDATTWLRRSLDSLEVEVQVDTWAGLQGRSWAELNDSDLLFVGGGNTFRLLDHIQRHGFAGAVQGFVQRGGAYYGGSAGAIVACDNIRVATMLDSNDLGLTDFSALGLLSEVAVMPHFNDDQLTKAHEWSAAHHTVVLGIPEESGVVASGSDLHVLGTQPVREVRASREMIRQPGDVWTLLPA